MATHAQFATVSPARARATFASKRRNGARPSRRSISSISRARRQIVPPRPPRARELDADPTRPQSIAAVSVRATATAKKPTAIAAGGDYALELEIATDAVRMASTLCQEVQGQLMRQDEQAVTKDDQVPRHPRRLRRAGARPTVARIRRSSRARSDGGAFFIPILVTDLPARLARRSLSLSGDHQLAHPAGVARFHHGRRGGCRGARRGRRGEHADPGEDHRARQQDAAAHQGDAAPELTASDLVELINKGKGSGGKGRHWVLDPVDGTLGFVRGDQYAIALALMEDGVLKVGAMGCPGTCPRWARCSSTTPRTPTDSPRDW